jgi:hypothetical protein
MREPVLSTTVEEDLPRAFRREKEARKRAAAHVAEATWQTGVVTAFKIPFPRLVVFFIKAAFAAMPALLMLTVLLWLFGRCLTIFAPELVKMQILIRFPN